MTYRQCDKTIHNNIPITRFIEEINNGEYLLSYPGQRKADQWDNMKKSMLITSFLFGEDVDSIKISEKILGGMHIYYIIDGMQRTSTIMEFLGNQFRLSKDIDMPVYEYHKTVRDSNGAIVMADCGVPKKEVCEFDLRGKRWKDFPEEVKKNLLDYNLQTVKHLDCSDARIAHDIIRYNNSQSMNQVQSAMARVNVEYAQRIRDIVDNNDLFIDHISLTPAQRNKSVPERIVMEAIMATRYLDGWNKTTSKVADYLNHYSQVSDYVEINKSMGRLADVVSEESDELFTAKNAYTWIALFDRFERYGITPERFNDFMEAFMDELKHTNIDDVCWDDLDTRNSKDKATVIRRLDYLETLMIDFLGIDEKKISDDDMEKLDEYGLFKSSEEIEDCLVSICGDKKRYSSTDIEDLIFYRSCLEDWICMPECDCDVNIPEAIGIVAYTYRNDIPEKRAIKTFIENANNLSCVIGLLEKSVA